MKAFYADGKMNLWQADVLDWALWYRGEIEAGKALTSGLIYAIIEPSQVK